MGFNTHGPLTTDMTKQLCHFIKTLQYEDIPPAVIERAKMMVMHTCGVSLCSSELKQIKDAIEISKEMSPGNQGTATLWADGKKVSWEAAAFTAGTMGDCLDWEDCSVTGHPSAGVIPAAVIATEVLHKSGKDLLTAVVVGYEVYQRIACAVQPSDERWKTKGWGLTSWQIFGCIIPVAKLYGLDARKINQAIGLGCECSTLPTAYHATTMSDFYHYEHGYRACDGFLITKAAEKGTHNQRDALDCPRCYTAVICGDAAKSGSTNSMDAANESDETWLTRDLGERYLIMETLLKHWPANMWVQTPV